MRHVPGHCLCFAVLLLALQANGQIAGPRLGYVWEARGRALLPVDGVPGAAVLGKPAKMGIEVETVAVSQRAGVVFAIGAGDRTPYLFRLSAGVSAPQPIEGATTPVHRIALSPSGSAAALYNGSEGLLQVVTGIPQQPVIARSLAVSGAGRVAVSDDGALMAVTATDGSAAVLKTATGEPLSIPVSGPVSSIAFRPLSHDLLIASAGLITLVRAIDTDPSYQTLTDLPADPVALAFSADGLRLVGAYSDGRVQMSDLSSREFSPVWCLCRPNGLELLSGDSVFALRTDGPQPLFLFEGAKNRVVFVGTDDQ